MTTTQTIYFECPTCHERFAQTEVFETEIHMGETYHCGECGGQVVFQALSIEDYVPPPRARRDCYFCSPEPCKFGPSTSTDHEEGETS